MSYASGLVTGMAANQLMNLNQQNQCESKKQVTTCNKGNNEQYTCFTECVPLTIQQKVEVVGLDILGIAILIIGFFACLYLIDKSI